MYFRYCYSNIGTICLVFIIKIHMIYINAHIIYKPNHNNKNLKRQRFLLILLQPCTEDIKFRGFCPIITLVLYCNVIVLEFGAKLRGEVH